ARDERPAGVVAPNDLGTLGDLVEERVQPRDELGRRGSAEDVAQALAERFAATKGRTAGGLVDSVRLQESLPRGPIREELGLLEGWIPRVDQIDRQRSVSVAHPPIISVQSA